MTTWRGFDEGDPTPLNSLLDKLGRRIGAPPARTASTLFEGWADAVGTTVAEHAKPVALHERVLVVEVDHPSWATQVRLLSGELLQRLAEVAGDGVVEALEVRVSTRRRSQF